jgi:S1-C subfamily serine protease
VEQKDNRWLLGFGLLGCMVVMCTLAIGGSMLFYRASGLAGSSANRSSVADAARAVTEPLVAQMTQAAAPSGALAPRAATPPPELEALPLDGNVSTGGADLTRLYQQVNPGVVSLGVVQEEEINGRTFRQLGGGSGFVYDDRHIVTNNHVAADSESIEVIFHDGQHRQGTVVGADAYSDLAVVRVDDLPAGVRSLPLVGNFDSLQVGQPVIAIGSPFGRANSMTYGIISALGRTIPTGLEAGFSIPQTIQTDAAINPGNSGGPLLDLSGQVIGINAQISTASADPGNGSPANSGVGFAIPASIVARVAPVLIEKGAYQWPYLGVGGLPQEVLTVEVAEANGLPDARGAYIFTVRPDGPSVGVLRGVQNQAAGDSGSEEDLVPLGGDVVVAINGTPIYSFDDLLTYIAIETTPGQTVQLTVIREGQTISVPVTLKQRPR